MSKFIPSSNKFSTLLRATTANYTGLTISFTINASLSAGNTIEITFSNPDFFQPEWTPI